MLERLLGEDVRIERALAFEPLSRTTMELVRHQVERALVELTDIAIRAVQAAASGIDSIENPPEPLHLGNHGQCRRHRRNEVKRTPGTSARRCGIYA